MYIFNGEIREENEWVNRSFKYGDGLFETLRIYDGSILFWEEHLKRLSGGMDVLKMTAKQGLFGLLLQKNARHLIEKAGITGHGRLRIHVFRQGKGAYGPIDRTAAFLIEAFGFEGNTYNSLHPVSLCAYHGYALHPSPLNGCKTANSLPYILAAMHAQDEGYDEALLFTQEGYVSEASSSNLFFIQNKKVITPPLSTFCLDGVMRRQVLKLCEELKVPLLEKRFKLSELKKAEAIFLTNAVRGLIPVGRFEDREILSHGHPLLSFLKTCLLQYAERQLSLES